MKPIIFVLGLSGVGKTTMAKLLSKDYSLLHIDIDRKGGGFTRAGFPPEWDKDVAEVDFVLLAGSVRSRLGNQYQGAILSFPTTCLFRREQFDIASVHGIYVVILWGTLEHCWTVRCARQMKNKGTIPDHADYIRKNMPTFEMYSDIEYDNFKVDAFQPDGSRPSCAVLVEIVLSHLTNQGVNLTVI